MWNEHEQQNQKKLKFIQNVLPQLILNYNEDLKDYSVLECIAEKTIHLDGLQSSILAVDLKLKNANNDETQIQLIVKMPDDKQECDTEFLFTNEIYAYRNVIPYFKKFLTTSLVTNIYPEHWTPRIYYISAEHQPYNESILVMENLIAQNYRLGSKLDLDEEHLKLMIQLIAEFHSVSYAMRIKKDPMFKKLIKGLIPFTFISPEGKFRETYRLIYKHALERCFNSIENNIKLIANKKFLEKVNKLKNVVSENPFILMQTFLTTDDIWSIILHGDYNRNNVLFEYDSQWGHKNPKNVKMIDFQEVRYATPVLDLAFFMYMNLHSSLRSSIWNSLLKLYHQTIIKCLTDILKCSIDDPKLAPYTFDKFMNHFSEYAFYGVMVSIMFIPFMATSESECQKLMDTSFADIPEYARFMRICGGEGIDERMTSIIAHAYDEGYMNIFE